MSFLGVQFQPHNLKAGLQGIAMFQVSLDTSFKPFFNYYRQGFVQGINHKYGCGMMVNPVG